VPTVIGRISHCPPVPDLALVPSVLMYSATSYLSVLTIRLTVKATFTLSSLPRQAPNTVPMGCRGPLYGAQQEICCTPVARPLQLTAASAWLQEVQGTAVPPPQLQLHGGSAIESKTRKLATLSNFMSFAVHPRLAPMHS